MRITERIFSFRIDLFPNTATHPDLGSRTWPYLPYLPYTTSPTSSYPIPPYPVSYHPVLNCHGKEMLSVLNC